MQWVSTCCLLLILELHFILYPSLSLLWLDFTNEQKKTLLTESKFLSLTYEYTEQTLQKS